MSKLRDREEPVRGRTKVIEKFPIEGCPFSTVCLGTFDGGLQFVGLQVLSKTPGALLFILATREQGVLKSPRILELCTDLGSLAECSRGKPPDCGIHALAAQAPWRRSKKPRDLGGGAFVRSACARGLSVLLPDRLGGRRGRSAGVRRRQCCSGAAGARGCCFSCWLHCAYSLWFVRSDWNLVCKTTLFKTWSWAEYVCRSPYVGCAS